MSNFKLSDSVSMRLVQIFQEAIMTGVDGADLLRQVKLTVDSSDPTSLVLAPEYVQQVKDMHEKLVKQAEELRDKQGSKLILGSDGSDDN